MSNNKARPAREKQGTRDEKAAARDERGFTLVEAVIAIFIMTVGLIGTAAAITYALEFSAISRNVTKAKLLVVASIEEIESLRNSRRLDFKQFANAGAVDNADAQHEFLGFADRFLDVSVLPGADGVNGTADDLSIDAGADGAYGTDDDQIDAARVRHGYQRKIEITDLSPTMKKIVVRVRYASSAGKLGEIVGVSYLNDETRLMR